MATACDHLGLSCFSHHCHNGDTPVLVKTEGDVVTFSGSAMGIDTDALAHFALGVLWKGSVHQWKTVEGQTSSVKLGAFREQIRTYLLGRSGFPSGVFVIVTACEDRGSRGMVFAPNLNKSAGSHGTMFSLLTRGIWFHIITDENAAPGIKDLCCVQSEKKVLHLQDCTKELIEAGRHVHKTARVSSNVSPRRSK